MAFRFKNLRKNKAGPNTANKEKGFTSSPDTTPAKRLKLTDLPDIPPSETEDTYKDHIKRIQREFAKTKGKNQQLIKTLMDATFAFRRREIVQDGAPVHEILKKFPALTLTSEVKFLIMQCRTSGQFHVTNIAHFVNLYYN